jgi:hypothetical protein
VGADGEKEGEVAPRHCLMSCFGKLACGKRRGFKNKLFGDLNSLIRNRIPHSIPTFDLCDHTTLKANY